MKDILISVFTLGILGALFGVLLGVFNEKFKVEESPLAQAIYEVLPHGECGACGFPGCHPCAEAIAEGRASYDACVVGGKEVEEKIRKIMEEAKSQS
ncbi:MAG: RnfABCDGE type electron transport complex subunit B [Caldisericum sp.]|jgi:electron transport complex protein RnfB|nr:RnfABCDGE type electron transport complex subunit B [Caldisericum sp.]